MEMEMGTEMEMETREDECYSISSKVNGYTTTTSVAGGRL